MRICWNEMKQKKAILCMKKIRSVGILNYFIHMYMPFRYKKRKILKSHQAPTMFQKWKKLRVLCINWIGQTYSYEHVNVNLFFPIFAPNFKTLTLSSFWFFPYTNKLYGKLNNAETTVKRTFYIVRNKFPIVCERFVIVRFVGGDFEWNLFWMVKLCQTTKLVKGTPFFQVNETEHFLKIISSYADVFKQQK